MKNELNFNIIDKASDIYDSNLIELPRNVRIPFLSFDDNNGNINENSENDESNNSNDKNEDNKDNDDNQDNKENKENKDNNNNKENKRREIPIFDLNKIFQINLSYNFDILKSLLETLITNQVESQKELLNLKKENEIKINEIERMIVDMKIALSNPHPKVLEELQKEKQKLQQDAQKIKNKIIKEKVLENKERNEANAKILNELAVSINCI
jgi:hypothetical protein